MKSIIITSVLSFFLLICHTSISAVTLSDRCQSALFSDESLTEETEQLSIYSRLFLKVHCGLLPKGSYVITTQWLDEIGRLQAERAHKFKIGFPRYHTAKFKFKQMPKGTIRRMMSGNDFEKHQYGKWSVLTFINNEEIDRKYFTITE